MSWLRIEEQVRAWISCFSWNFQSWKTKHNQKPCSNHLFFDNSCIPQLQHAAPCPTLHFCDQKHLWRSKSTFLGGYLEHHHCGVYLKRSWLIFQPWWIYCPSSEIDMKYIQTYSSMLWFELTSTKPPMQWKLDMKIKTSYNFGGREFDQPVSEICCENNKQTNIYTKTWQPRKVSRDKKIHSATSKKILFSR